MLSNIYARIFVRTSRPLQRARKHTAEDGSLQSAQGRGQRRIVNTTQKTIAGLNFLERQVMLGGNIAHCT